MANSFRIPGCWDVSDEQIIRSAFAGEGYDWGGMMLYLDRVHEMGITGKGVSVVVLDTGYYPGHPDLANNIQVENFVAGEDEIDVVGHSTHVRGIISMQRNGKGLVGVAPGAKCHIGKTLSDSGFGTIKDFNKGLEWAIFELQADIINLSLSGGENKRTRVLVQEAEAKNILIVAASGNSAEQKVGFPASIPYVVAVGAHDQNERLASFSNTGSKPNELNIVSPGVGVRSTWNDGDYRRADGTSMATPYVSGVCALIIQWLTEKQGHWPTVEHVKQVLYRSCLDLGNVGPDLKYGCGRTTTDFTGVQKINDPPEGLPDGCLFGKLYNDIMNWRTNG